MTETQITKNFQLKEFNCKCGCEMPTDIVEQITELAENLQIIRDSIPNIKSLIVVSGYRCIDYNNNLREQTLAYNKKNPDRKRKLPAKKSQHLSGKAADIQVNLENKKMDTADIYNVIEDLTVKKKIKQGGLGLYNNFVHYDIRGTKARW